jgi:Tol biopolymer transport system component
MLRILLWLIVLFISSLSFGQKEAQPFLPKVFEKYPNVRDIAISPDGKEVYFTVDDLKSRIAIIVFITKTNTGWSEPETVSFTGNYRDLEPAFSPDGKKLFFASNRPVHKDSISPKDYDIWYVDRLGAEWSAPKNLGQPINTSGHEFYPSITHNGDIYFTSERSGTVGSEDIFVSRIENSKYQEPYSLPGALNTKYYEFNAFVAPNESYLIFSGQRPNEGKGRGELYISYNHEGMWSEGKLLERVNSEYLDFCPFVDVNTNTFYFTSQKTSVKRHYKKAIELDSFLKMYSDVPKGLNRIYHIDFKELTKD